MSRSKNKMGYSLAVFLTLVLVGAVESARAEVLIHNFTGTIMSVPNPPPYGLSLSVGDPVTGSVAYDPSGGYIQPPPSGMSGMSVVIGGATVQSTGNASLQVLNNAIGGDHFSAYFTPIAVNGMEQPSDSHAMIFALSDSSGTVFSSTALTLSGV